MAKLPERHRRDVKARFWRVFDETASPAEVRRGLGAIVADYRSGYSSAMNVIERDLDALVAHLRWPSEHGKRIRSTNLLESHLRRAPPAHEGDRALPGRDLGAVADLGGARTVLARLAGVVMTPRAVDEIERLRRRQASTR